MANDQNLPKEQKPETTLLKTSGNELKPRIKGSSGGKWRTVTLLEALEIVEGLKVNSKFIIASSFPYWYVTEYPFQNCKSLYISTHSEFRQLTLSESVFPLCPHRCRYPDYQAKEKCDIS